MPSAGSEHHGEEWLSFRAKRICQERAEVGRRCLDRPGVRGAMSEKTWDAVDRYLETTLLDEDPVLKEALKRSQEAGLPAIQVSPLQGQFLHLLARSIKAERVLEIGTLGGYSTICLARALPKDRGHLISLEIDPKHAEVARSNLTRAGVGEYAEVWVGAALDLLPRLRSERWGPVDLTFIDADKANNATYLDWAVRFSHKGSMIVIDNVVREGTVLQAESPDPAVRGTREVLSRLGKEGRVEATALQMVGSKGYDGFAVALVKEDP